MLNSFVGLFVIFKVSLKLKHKMAASEIYWEEVYSPSFRDSCELFNLIITTN